MKQIPLAIAVAAGLSVHAQQLPAVGDLKFEVASVKPNKSGSNRVNVTPQPGGRFTATNVSAMDLIAIAYGEARPFPRPNILGAPSWVSRDRFDIAAKANGNPTQDEVSRMLRPLLAERFRLVLHPETRERPIYMLTLARRDGSLGPGLRQSTLACSGPRDALPAGCEMLSVPGTLKARGTPIDIVGRRSPSRHRCHRPQWHVRHGHDVDAGSPTGHPAGCLAGIGPGIEKH